ncbi:MAG TPA: hypothetical protein VIJ20_02395, partial [Solirubrobacteraceae bacterium]
MRLKAALCTTVLAASLATPTLQGAAASSTVPALPDVNAALLAAGISTTNVNSILSELSSLQGLAPGGSLGLLGLGSLDDALTTLNGGLLGSLLTPVLDLLAALNPAAPSSLTQTLADLKEIGSAAGASTTVIDAVSELTATLTTAGLGQLLTQLSGLTSGENTSALTALAGLQSLPLGGNVSAGSLAPVATVLSTLAGETGAATAAPALDSAASTLNASGAITPAQLLSVIGEVQSAAASLPAPLGGVASALAAQLSAASSLFGELASVGSILPSGSITGALTGLGGLPGLSPGASVPGTTLGSLGTVLTTLAGEPGVPTTAATTLDGAAASLNGTGALDPSQLLSLIGSLQGVSGLPAPLGTLLSDVTGALGASGSIFGGVPGLSSGQVTGALAALGDLPGLAAGSSVPSGLLAPVGGIVSEIAAQPGVPTAAAAALDTVAGTLTSAGALDPASLQGLISTLQSVSSSLPSPLNTVVGQLIQLLSGSGSLTTTGGGGGTGGGGTGGGGTGGGGTGDGGTGGGGTTGAGGGTGTGGGTGFGGTGTGTGTGGSGTGGAGGAGGGSTAGHAGHASISRVQRQGDVIVVTLR